MYRWEEVPLFLFWSQNGVISGDFPGLAGSFSQGRTPGFSFHWQRLLERGSKAGKSSLDGFEHRGSGLPAQSFWHCDEATRKRRARGVIPTSRGWKAQSPAQKPNGAHQDIKLRGLFCVVKMAEYQD